MLTEEAGEREKGIFAREIPEDRWYTQRFSGSFFRCTRETCARRQKHTDCIDFYGSFRAFVDRSWQIVDFELWQIKEKWFSHLWKLWVDAWRRSRAVQARMFHNVRQGNCQEEWWKVNSSKQAVLVKHEVTTATANLAGNEKNKRKMLIQWVTLWASTPRMLYEKCSSSSLLNV